jgi:hypothetical protein
VADPWQASSYQIKLPSWAQVSPSLVQGYERAEQMRAARGILTGKKPESWMQRASMSDPANWMTGSAPQSQGWQGIFGIPESAPSGTKPKPQPSGSAPAAPAAVLSDDVDVRASEARRMLQQATPYWEREENKGLLQAAQVGGGPRAGEAGYAQRADIAAWIEANKNAPKGVDGKNIVDRFLEKQQRQGLLDAPEQTPGLGGTRIAMPVDAESAAQAGRRGLVGFEGSALEQAQANVSELQGRERAAMSQKIWQAAADGTLKSPIAASIGDQAPEWAQSAQATVNPAAFSGLDIGKPFVNPEFNRQYASLAQPTGAQAIATGTGTGATMQPSSAAAEEVGVEPAQADAPGNTPNPADDLARRYIDGLRSTRAARLGF